MVVSDEKLGKLEGTLELMNSSLERLTDTLLSEGGLVERTTRIEEKICSCAVTMNEQKEAVNEIKKSLSELKESVENHHNDKELHSPRMLLKKEVIFYVVAGFLVIHSLLPANLDLWEIIKKYLGL